MEPLIIDPTRLQDQKIIIQPESKDVELRVIDNNQSQLPNQKDLCCIVCCDNYTTARWMESNNEIENQQYGICTLPITHNDFNHIHKIQQTYKIHPWFEVEHGFFIPFSKLDKKEFDFIKNYYVKKQINFESLTLNGDKLMHHLETIDLVLIEIGLYKFHDLINKHYGYLYVEIPLSPQQDDKEEYEYEVDKRTQLQSRLSKGWLPASNSSLLYYYRFKNLQKKDDANKIQIYSHAQKKSYTHANDSYVFISFASDFFIPYRCAIVYTQTAHVIFENTNYLKLYNINTTNTVTPTEYNFTFLEYCVLFRYKNNQFINYSQYSQQLLENLLNLTQENLINMPQLYQILKSKTKIYKIPTDTTSVYADKYKWKILVNNNDDEFIKEINQLIQDKYMITTDYIPNVAHLIKYK